MTGVPVFLLASERSGTNLLRRRLSEQQTTVVGPPPLHFLKHLFHAAPFYGDFSDDRVFREFVKDSLGLAYNHFSPWDEVIDVEEVVEKYSTYFSGARSPIGVMHVLYMIYATRKGYISYFCKDNNLFDFVCEIASSIPGSRFVYLYRDPRDVVLSQQERPNQNRDTFYLARRWRDEQIKCIGRSQVLSGTGRLVSLSYEDLIEDEESQIAMLCRTLDLGKDGVGKVDYGFENTDLVEWQNLSKPTMSNNAQKYREQLSSKAIQKIEFLAWHQMYWLGYSPDNVRRPQFSRVGVEMGARLGGLSRLIRNRMFRNRLTEGQKKRSAYTRTLQQVWK